MRKTFNFNPIYTDFLFRLIIGILSTLLLLYVGFTKKNETLLILSFFFALYSVIQFYKKGIDFDLKEMKYREFYSLFTIKLGEWKTLNKISYINIYRTKSTKHSFILRAPDRSMDVLGITIFFDNQNSLQIHSFEKENEAFEVAKNLKKFLNTPLYNATTDNPSWM